MLDRFLQNFRNLWNNIYNADSWTEATLVGVLLTTFLVSLIFTIRMSRYPNKSFLDWMILLREVGWVLIAFRFLSSYGFEWEGWLKYSWVLWGYVGFVTILALLASQREHYLAKYHNRGERWRFRPKKYNTKE